MIKHSYIILPPRGAGGRQTVISLTIHGDPEPPKKQNIRKQKKNQPCSSS